LSCRAVVTGATSGIGLAAAEALAEEGCDIVVSARGLDRLEALARDLSSRFGARVTPVQVDLTKEGEAARLASEAVKALGAVDFAFVSYGNPPCEPCEPADASWSDWETAFSMYVASPAAFMSGLIRLNPAKATVVLVSSFSSRAPMWPTGLADVVRASLPALAKLFSRRYPERIRAIVLELGSFRTPGAERLIGALASREGVSPEDFWKERVADFSPLRRLGRPEELKELVRWLLRSPEYLTGTTILFDGATLGCV